MGYGFWREQMTKPAQLNTVHQGMFFPELTTPSGKYYLFFR
jgi:hypothetical protein